LRRDRNASFSPPDLTRRSRFSSCSPAAILVTTAAGTACVAPFITYGLLPLATAATVLVAVAMLLLYFLPELDDTKVGESSS
jgi:hypothetical protein